MPLMLDNNMAVDLNDVDDLFGDGAPLSLANRNAGKQLRRRMDQLRSRGCRQYVILAFLMHLALQSSKTTRRN